MIFPLTNIDTFQPKIDKLHVYIKKLVSLQSFIFTFYSLQSYVQINEGCILIAET